MTRMTAEEYKAFQARIRAKYDAPDQKQSKYRNVRTEVDGIKFDSKAEAKHYCTLKFMQLSGEIRWFQRQPSFLVSREVRYRPDFIICDKSGKVYVADVKGVRTKEFDIKEKLFKEKYPDIELRIVP